MSLSSLGFGNYKLTFRVLFFFRFFISKIKINSWWDEWMWYFPQLFGSFLDRAMDVVTLHKSGTLFWNFVWMIHTNIVNKTMRWNQQKMQTWWFLQQTLIFQFLISWEKQKKLQKETLPPPLYTFWSRWVFGSSYHLFYLLVSLLFFSISPKKRKDCFVDLYKRRLKVIS